jgi:alkylhydroperoxidase/carboxymuconolactone decarboxylase family protein YurZ
MADGYAAFLKEAPAVAAGYQTFVEALAASDGLDGKTKHLIYIALNAATGSPGAAVAHVGFAKQLGASRAEVRDAILMTLTIAGLRGVTSTLAEVLAAYDR